MPNKAITAITKNGTKNDTKLKSNSTKLKTNVISIPVQRKYVTDIVA